MIIVDDSMIHESRGHDVLPAKLTPNPYSNRPQVCPQVDLYKFAECNSGNRRTSMKRRSIRHVGANGHPWRPLALWDQFVATDYLCERLLSDVTLDRLSKGIYQRYCICVQGTIRLKSRLRTTAPPFRRRVIGNHRTLLHQTLE